MILVLLADKCSFFILTFVIVSHTGPPPGRSGSMDAPLPATHSPQQQQPLPPRSARSVDLGSPGEAAGGLISPVTSPKSPGVVPEDKAGLASFRTAAEAAAAAPR
jgi:hypothetical protein